MAGSATITEKTVGSIKFIKWAWTSDASTGNVTGAVTTNSYNGELLFVAIASDSGGTQPTDAYDVTITDGVSSLDVLCGNGADIDRSATQYFERSDNLMPVTGTLTLALSNAGNSKGGDIYFWIR